MQRLSVWSVLLASAVTWGACDNGDSHGEELDSGSMLPADRGNDAAVEGDGDSDDPVDGAHDVSTEDPGIDASASSDAGEVGSDASLDAAMDASGSESDAAAEADASQDPPDAGEADGSTEADAGPGSTFSPAGKKWYSPTYGNIAISADGKSALTWNYLDNVRKFQALQIVHFDAAARSMVMGPVGAVDWGRAERITWSEPAEDGSIEVCSDTNLDDEVPCDAQSARTFVPGLEIGGVFDPYGYLGSDVWNMSNDAVPVAAYDNDANVLFLSNDGDPLSDDRRKLVWKEPESADSIVYLCQVDDSTADAVPETVADPEDLQGGCNGAPWRAYNTLLEIAGTYSVDASRTYMIYGDATFGLTSGTFADYHTMVSYDNGEHYALVLRNGTEDQYAKFYWARSGVNTLYLCVTAYDVATASEALATPAPDASNPGVSGCGAAGDQPWIQMFLQIGPNGYLLASGDSAAVDSFIWGGRPVVDYNNDLDALIVQDEDGTYRRIEWALQSSTYMYYLCNSAVGQASADAARRAATWADRSSFPNGGCNGGAWTSMAF